MLSHRRLPRFPGPDANAHGAVLQGTGGVGHVFEDVMAGHDLRRFESRVGEGLDEFCFQQTAGNSAGPQSDVVQGCLRHRARHHDVAELEPSAGAQGPGPLPQRALLVQRQVQHAIAYEHVGLAVL